MQACSSLGSAVGGRVTRYALSLRVRGNTDFLDFEIHKIRIIFLRRVHSFNSEFFLWPFFKKKTHKLVC